jgi:hypothetical protein
VRLTLAGKAIDARIPAGEIKPSVFRRVVSFQRYGESGLADTTGKGDRRAGM